jgi:hypothetical protein
MIQVMEKILKVSTGNNRCATSRTVPGSIPSGVTGFFSDIFPSNHTMTLGSTQLLMKMSTRNIPESKGGQCMRLTTSAPSCAECREIWEPKLLGPSGPHWACYGTTLPVLVIIIIEFIIKHNYITKIEGCDSSVSIATRYGLDSPGIESQCG